MSKTAFHEQLLNRLGLSHVQTVRVKHCRDSFGISVTSSEGFKVVYSGDAMPTPALSVVGKDCDVLIHEATMDDQLLDEALIKRHSTTSQAMEMARSMNAKYTVLTHFSQRYAKIPVINPGLFEANQVGCAMDNMMVRRRHLNRLLLLHEPLRLMFNDKQQDMVQRMQRRNLRKELHQELLTEINSKN